MFNKTYYIVLTKNEIFVERTLKKLNSKVKGLIDNTELKRIGSHYVANMTDEDITFTQDKRRMANIPWQHLIKKDNTIMYYFIIMLIIELIVLIKC